MTSEHKFSYTSPVPLEVSWKTLRKGDKLLPQLLPQLFAKIDIVEGNGGVGTVRVVTLGPGIGPEGAGKQVKERIDVLDESTHTLVYSVIEGGDPRYSNAKNTLKFRASGNSTVTEWIFNYTPISSDVPPPKHLEDFAVATAKALADYANEHPSEFA